MFDFVSFIYLFIYNDCAITELKGLLTHLKSPKYND